MSRKSKKPVRQSKPQQTVPWLMSALFCQEILDEKDNVLSCIRVIDILTIPKPPQELLDSDTVPVTDIKALVAFKCGDVTGEHVIRIIGKSPSGKELVQRSEYKATFMGVESGINLRIRMLVPIKEQGLYWYGVYFDDTLVTQMPLRIRHVEEPALVPEPPSSQTRARSKNQDL